MSSRARIVLLLSLLGVIPGPLGTIRTEDEVTTGRLSADESTRVRNIGAGWYKVRPRPSDVALVQRALHSDDLKTVDWACLAVEKMAGRNLFSETAAQSVIPLLISQMTGTRDDTSEFSMRALGAMAGRTSFLKGPHLRQTLGMTLESLASTDPERRRRAANLAVDLVRGLDRHATDRLIRAVLAAVSRRGPRDREADVRAHSISLRTLSVICKHITDRKLAADVASELVASLNSPAAEQMRIHMIMGAADLVPRVDNTLRDRIVDAVIAAAEDHRYIYSMTSGVYTPPLHAGVNALASVAPSLDADALQRAEHCIPASDTREKSPEYEAMYAHALRALALRRKQLNRSNEKHSTGR